MQNSAEHWEQHNIYVLCVKNLPAMWVNDKYFFFKIYKNIKSSPAGKSSKIKATKGNYPHIDISCFAIVRVLEIRNVGD